LRRGLDADVRDGPLIHRPFDERVFVEDLRTARAVISGGGFTLMSEAVFLHRPMLSIPVKKQFEQVLNGRYLQRLGFGLTAAEVTGEGVGQLLERSDELAGNLAAYRQDGNRETLAALDAVLAEAVRGPQPSPPAP
jgi:uncharacterized protein (TIGR00661 family)